jgi:hypothetical protein
MLVNQPAQPRSDEASASSSFTPDAGPWSLFFGSDKKLLGVLSDDFSRDVSLRVDGDFADEAERLAYIHWLRDTLTAAGPRSDRARLEVCLQSLHNCYREFSSISAAVAPALALLQSYQAGIEQNQAQPGAGPVDEKAYQALVDAVSALSLAAGLAHTSAHPLRAVA